MINANIIVPWRCYLVLLELFGLHLTFFFFSLTEEEKYIKLIKQNLN